MIKLLDVTLMICISVCMFIVLSLKSCWFQKKPLFSTIDSAYSNIYFTNTNVDSDTLNILDYLYFYNGAGVAAADFNNDNLVDIYFVSNTEHNQLYLNRGNFRFDSVTAFAGVGGMGNWNTGVTVVDINQDGWKDIYLCSVGGYKNLQGRNQLFVNQTDGTFKEEAKKYGLDIEAFSSHASFFDYDKDGDLDLLLLNHSVHSAASYGDTSLKKKYSPRNGPHLLRNDQMKYTDVSIEAGIFPSAVSYGLGLSIGDINLDGWDDIYISNDFHEDDYLFVNQRNGEFKEEARKRMGHFSNFSMGNAMVDINHDGYTDIISTDMLPLDREELYATESDLPNDIYERKLSYGYYYQYSRNTLQLNQDKGNYFIDVGLYADIASTDWTWGVLSEDFNHDGYIDLFFTNGIKRRMNDIDYIKYLETAKKTLLKVDSRDNDFDQNAISKMPSGAVPNMLFEGSKSLLFKDISNQSGISHHPFISQGSVAVDLDNDGDLELVTNNLNDKASLFENKTDALFPRHSFLQLRFLGSAFNRDGIGVKVFAKSGGQIFTSSQYYHTGFLSGRSDFLHMSFGQASTIDSLFIVWPNFRTQLLLNVHTNQRLIIDIEDAGFADEMLAIQKIQTFLLQKKKQYKITPLPEGVLNWTHQENGFYDNNINRLIPHFYSRQGPAIAIGDLNGDSQEDVYLGGAIFQSPSIALRSKGKDIQFDVMEILDDSATYSEDIQAEIVDMNQDGKKDIVVACAGNQPSYIGVSGIWVHFQKTIKAFQRKQIIDSIFVQDMEVIDINQDGLYDIIASARMHYKLFGAGSRLYAFMNQGNGNFKDESKRLFQSKHIHGIVSDIVIKDLDSDSFFDIILAGEWMPVSVLYGSKNQFSKSYSISKTGLWQSLSITDLDEDGNLDIVAGNWGTNTKLKASSDYPLKLFYGDIDGNGIEDLILAQSTNGIYYPFLPKNILETQLPYLKKKYRSYRLAAKQDVHSFFEGKLDEDYCFEAKTLTSQVFLQKKIKSFKAFVMPKETQFAPILSSQELIINQQKAVLLGTNFFGTSTQEGRYDAGIVGFLLWDEATNSLNFAYDIDMHLNFRKSIMDIKVINMNHKKSIICLGSNNGRLRLFSFNH